VLQCVAFEGSRKRRIERETECDRGTTRERVGARETEREGEREREREREREGKSESE